MQISELTITDYDALLDLWRRIPEITLREADSRESLSQFFRRNPNLSFSAWEEGRMIGAALCGHDGRRGYLHHVSVEPAFRGRGIAHDLIIRCLDQLEAIGILKTHIDVFITNDLANNYWMRRGWQRRNDVYRYSYNRSGNENA